VSIIRRENNQNSGVLSLIVFDEKNL